MPADLLRRAVRRLGRTLRPAPGASPAHPADPVPPVPVVGYVVAGGGGAHPASAHVRVVRRIEHLAASGAATVQQVEPDAFVSGTDTTEYAVLLVQRDILPIGVVGPFLDAARARAIRVVAEVDDDFFTEAGRARLARAEYDPDRLASIDAVVRGADVVIVSTEELAVVVRPIARDVVVVPNALDPTLWTAGTSAGTTPDPAAEATVAPPDDEHRVLYMGTMTHAADLELLEPVFSDLRAVDGSPVRLEVIGITEDSDARWYRRIEVPDGHYPAFARWLVANRSRWSAGVAPLRDEEFNRSKSDLKFLEYTALGLPAVVSDRPAYAEAARHGAVVVPDDVAVWRSAVVAAVAAGGPAPDTLAFLRRRTLGGDGSAWQDVLLQGRPGGAARSR
ncbi:glycosyltransferase [Curtobacterium sp. ISL-83]|uniref:glycosyltransferase n=1 Tax=Curtobacterium sp. ISL-83 TaxID=2819145 RepID=UPI001BE65D20|nr:glycosyltransferase [Curtobacterium sp. ISL-83]MBT2503072.1 glycosyltransferase [Curtobacterium sp. ISL-83]